MICIQTLFFLGKTSSRRARSPSAHETRSSRRQVASPERAANIFIEMRNDGNIKPFSKPGGEQEALKTSA